MSTKPLPKALDPTKRAYLAAAALILLTLLAYSNSFSAGFALDNQPLILGDIRIQTASSENVDLILNHTYWWPHGESGLYRPFTTLSYLFNYAILANENHPAGYHALNLALQAANVLLAFALLRRLLGQRPHALVLAFICALLWAAHPLLTESVTNIVGRADLLAGCAVLTGLLLYLDLPATTALNGALRLTGLSLAAFFGMFSKESAVVLPGLLVLYELCIGRSWRRLATGFLATLIPTAIMLWQRAAVLSSSPPAEYPFLDNPISGAGFWIGRLTAIKVLARYLWLACWPWKLSADYSYNSITLAHGTPADWLSCLLIAALLVLLLVLWKSNRLASFFAAFAFLNLLPASNLLFPIGTIMAERLLYLPLLGLIAAAALSLQPLASRIHLSRNALVISALLIVGAFTLRTWLRNRDWTDDTTIAAAGVQANPRSFKFHMLLAAQMLRADPLHRDLDNAANEADIAVSILTPLPDPVNSADAWGLAALCHRSKGETLSGDAARAQFQQTLQLAQRALAIDAATRAAYDQRHGTNSPPRPSAAETYRTLAFAFLRLDRPNDAMTAATEAQQLNPEIAEAYEQIAESAIAQNRAEDAAIALAEGMFAASDQNQNLLAALLKLYQSGLDTKGCAVVNGPHGPIPNPRCEIVHRDLCAAARRLGRADLARRMSCAD